MTLDEEKLEALRSWGERLGQAGGEESAAVGRAILMLVEEIDRLHIELWHARMQPRGGTPAATERPTEGGEEVVAGTPAVTERSTEGGEEVVASSLHARLQRVLRRDAAAEPLEPSGTDTESDGTTSPQAWIAALRRQR